MTQSEDEWRLLEPSLVSELFRSRAAFDLWFCNLVRPAGHHRGIGPLVERER